MPPLVAILVNYITINKKLSKPVLKLIRNEKKNNKISKINLNVKKICIYIVLGCAGSLLINKIIYFMKNKFYSDYDSVAWGMQGLGIGLIIIIPVFIFIIAFMMKDKLIEENPENNVFLNLLFCACVCFLLSTIISNFTRIAEYFYIVVIIFIPRI